MNKKVRIMEIGNGIGGITQAFQRQNIPYEIVEYVEIAKGTVNIYNELNETEFEPQDIKEWDKNIEVDFLMHGSPHQSFSLAGKQEDGNDGSETRFSLVNENIRIIQKLRPKYVLWENVRNLLSKNHIHNLQKYLKNMEDLGYNNSYQILNAKDFGIPQNRTRLYVVSILDKEKFEFPIGVKLEKSYKDYLEQDYDVEKTVLSEEQVERVTQYPFFAGRIMSEDEKIYPSITCSYGKVSGNSGKFKCSDGYRVLTPRECWRLMGFDDEEYEKAAKVCSNTGLVRQIGQASVVNVLEAIINKIYK